MCVWVNAGNAGNDTGGERVQGVAHDDVIYRVSRMMRLYRVTAEDVTGDGIKAEDGAGSGVI